MPDLLKLEIKKQFACDVLVVGGGVAGLSAAVCAARNGADVILCDKGNCLGGTATKGLVGPFMSAMDPTGQFQVIYGFLDEFVKRMEENGGADKRSRDDQHYSRRRMDLKRMVGELGVLPLVLSQSPYGLLYDRGRPGNRSLI